MTVLMSDPRTGTEMGISQDGDLYLSNKGSGCNMRDTPDNRERMTKDFYRYTKVDKEE